MPTDYIVRLKCPYGDRDELLMLENREESLQQILDSRWDFECPVHGMQHEMPLEGTQKSAWSKVSSRAKERKSVNSPPLQPRSSQRISLHVPVSVFGWSKDVNSFHEDALTVVVNASGALLALDSPVALGDTLFIRNKWTQQEQECRVASVSRHRQGKWNIGVAFKFPAPHFWRTSRREPRIAGKFRVKVHGRDRNGNRFSQTAFVVDVSRRGARLQGIGFLTWPGEIVQISRHLRKASFRVAWVGETGTPQAGDAGILALEPDKNVWGVKFP